MIVSEDRDSRSSVVLRPRFSVKSGGFGILWFSCNTFCFLTLGNGRCEQTVACKSVRSYLKGKVYHETIAEIDCSIDGYVGARRIRFGSS